MIANIADSNKLTDINTVVKNTEINNKTLDITVMLWTQCMEQSAVFAVLWAYWEKARLSKIVLAELYLSHISTGGRIQRHFRPGTKSDKTCWYASIKYYQPQTTVLDFTRGQTFRAEVTSPNTALIISVTNIIWHCCASTTYVWIYCNNFNSCKS